jgi:hypothetical protein
MHVVNAVIAAGFSCCSCTLCCYSVAAMDSGTALCQQSHAGPGPDVLLLLLLLL